MNSPVCSYFERVAKCGAIHVDPHSRISDGPNKYSGHVVSLIRVCLHQYNRLEYIANEIQITVQNIKRVCKPPYTGQQALALG